MTTATRTIGTSISTASLTALLTAVALIAAAIYPSPVALVAACFVPLAVLACVRSPVLVCTLFIAFSFFRLHEAYPSLEPLSIPQALGIMMIASLGLHTAVFGTIKPDWQTPLKWLAILVALILFGVVLAKNRQWSWVFVSEIYWKIIIVTVAVAWLMNSTSDFRTVARLLVVSGALLACVAIYNKIYGLSLVEGTRVSIARPPPVEGHDYWNDPLRNLSTLADPNDLALILLFPLAFAMALLVNRTSLFDRFLGLIGCATTMPAIIFTQSRGGLLGMITVFGILGLRKIKSRTVVIALCVGTAFVLAVAMGLSSRVSGGAAELSETGIDESARGRLIAWHAAVNMMIARPLTGVGINGFVDAYYQYTPEWGNRDKAVHSTWFQVVGEMGLPGIIVFLTMFVATFRSALRTLDRTIKTKADPMLQATALAMVAGLASFAVAGTFLTQAFTWPLYVLIALTVALNRVTSRQEATATGNIGTEGRLHAVRPPAPLRARPIDPAGEIAIPRNRPAPTIVKTRDEQNQSGRLGLRRRPSPDIRRRG